MSSGGFAVFVRVSGRLQGMPDWPAGVPRGLGIPCFPAAADPGERLRAGQGPGRARPAQPAPQASLTLRAAIR